MPIYIYILVTLVTYIRTILVVYLVIVRSIIKGIHLYLKGTWMIVGLKLVILLNPQVDGSLPSRGALHCAWLAKKLNG